MELPTRFSVDNSLAARTGRILALQELTGYKTPVVKEIPPKPPKVLQLLDLDKLTIREEESHGA